MHACSHDSLNSCLCLPGGVKGRCVCGCPRGCLSADVDRWCSVCLCVPVSSQTWTDDDAVAAMGTVSGMGVGTEGRTVVHLGVCIHLTVMGTG